MSSLAVLTLSAQTKVAGDIVKVTVTAQTVSTVATQAAARHWVLSQFPTEKDVQIADPTVRAQFLDALENFRTKAASCDHIILDGKPGDRCGFVASVSVPGIKLSISGPPEILKAPAATVPPKAADITLRGSWSPPQPPLPVRQLCIWAAIGPITGTFAAPDPSTTIVTLKDIPVAAGLGALPAEYQAIQIRTTDPANSPRNTPQLQAVAITAFLTARKLDMLPGSKNPPLHALEVRDALARIYNIDDSGWPDVRVRYIPVSNDGPDAGVYVLSVSNLQTVEHASVVLTGGELTDKALKGKLAEASCKVENRFQGQLTALEGKIPTNDGVWKLAKAIGMSNQVTGVVTPLKAKGQYAVCDKNMPASELAGPADNRIEFSGKHRWVIGFVKGDLTGSFSTSPHGIVTGNGKIGEDHRLLPNSRTLEDTASLSLNAGPKTQRSDLAFNVEAVAGSSQPVKFGAGFDGMYSRDNNQRYGYLKGPKYSDTPKFVDEEYGPTPRGYVAFERPTESYAFTANLRLGAGLQFRHVSIGPPDGYPPFLHRGWVNGFSGSLNALVGYEFGRTPAGATASPKPDAARPQGGLGKVFVTVSADELLPRKSLGDFDFKRYSARAQGELFWGLTSRQDFVIRYGRGVTAGSANTPLFELPELGGADNLRGIETGEYVGRGFGFEQVEAGINTMSFWGWVRKKKNEPVKAAVKAAAAAEPAPAASGAKTDSPPVKKPTLSSLGIESIFVVGLYDRAKLSTGSAVGSLLDLSHGFHGSGIKGEIRGLRAGNRKANLSFIYARSPSSLLHDKGVFITSVSLDF